MVDPWSYAEKTHSEHSEQVALFMWANMAAEFGADIANEFKAYSVAGWAKAVIDNEYKLKVALPQLKWLHAIPNQGTASAKRGLAMKAEGLTKGVFDVFLPWPTLRQLITDEADINVTDYSGLYIEMKRPKTATQAAGKLSDEQLEFKAYAESVGYKCVECWTWLEARDEILKYLGVGNG